MPEYHVFCGGLRSVRKPAGKSLELDVDAAAGSAAKVNLALGHIASKLVANIPSRFTDLLQLACYVYCADQFSRRDTLQMHQLGKNWRRRFHFHIPVRDLSFWSDSDVRAALTDSLSFLSDDDYDFEFVAGSRLAEMRQYLDFPEDESSRIQPDRVMLFSGGLDSFAGAADSVLAKGENAVLVSHGSSPMLHSRQGELVDELRQRTRSNQVFHVSVAANKGHAEASEFTQRSRSFLFAALGGVVARLFHRHEVTFFENGIVSLNLSIAEHVLGARATRTTHPRVLASFGKLLTLVAEGEFRFVNPFFWHTKGDVVRLIAELGCGDLIARTFSCARTREATQTGQHCGVCSQCIDRRFGVLAAGLRETEPAEAYSVELFTGARDPGPDITMAESYVLSALKFARMTQRAFHARYGQVFRALPYLVGQPNDNAQKIHELHKRHGTEVIEVVDRELERHGAFAAMQELPQTSLLAMIRTQIPRQPLLDNAELERAIEPPNQGHGPALQIQLGLDKEARNVVFASGAVLSGKSYNLIEELMSEFGEDQEADLPPEKYRFVRPDKLAARLSVEEQTLRQLVSRTRRSLATQHEAAGGLTSHGKDVIETAERKGYRLNPQLIVKPAAMIKSTMPRRTSNHSPSQVSQPLGKSPMV